MIAGLIIEHYLTWFPDIKSFYFAMFKPFMRAGNDRRSEYEPIEYFPSHPMFEVRVPKLDSEKNLCSYLEERFRQYKEKIGKKKGVYGSVGYIDEESFGFVSKVKLKNGKIIWLKLLDFNRSISPKNLRRVEVALKLLKTGPGLIVNSGNSYHFYGEIPFQDHNDWRNFYQGGRQDWDLDYGIPRWPRSAVRWIGINWPRLTLKQRFGMLRVDQCSIKPLDPKLEKYFLGGELNVRPLPGTPCIKRYRKALEDAMKLRDFAATDEDRQKIIDSWPYFKETRYCRLPCDFQGKFLSCPRLPQR